MKTYEGGGGGTRRSTKKIFEKLKKKIQKKYSCYGLKKIRARNLITKKNSCGSKIPSPSPPPKKNVSSGPSLLNAKVTFSADFLCFSLRLKDYITTLTLTTYYRLGNDRKSDGMHGNPKENGFP